MAVAVLSDRRDHGEGLVVFLDQWGATILLKRLAAAWSFQAAAFRRQGIKCGWNDSEALLGAPLEVCRVMIFLLHGRFCLMIFSTCEVVN